MRIIGQTEEAAIILSKFGVKGDGKTDDSGAFQKAIDYCEKNSMKSLYIPNGNYFLKKPVIFNRGGVQLIGTGALLREESWLHLQKQFSDTQPFSGCSFIIDNNIEGFIFSKTVSDPVRIRDIQFISQKGRKPGNTTAIAFKSEFRGPTWPFIIERCHFRGFNYAIKFESPSQYCVAFVQINQCAFSQNDECVYFADVPTLKNTPVGYRNLTWGFTFTNNKCHDNSRVIRAAFAKDLVTIANNNMEGNIPYSSGKNPGYIVDIELSHATIHFEGNHFESTISDCVYISSAFKHIKGNFLPYSGRTTNSELNRVHLKGNNFDGISDKYKPYVLKGLNIYNYDNYNLFLDECTLLENQTNSINTFLTDYAKTNGSTLKTPVSSNGKYQMTTNNNLLHYKNAYAPASEKTFLINTPLGNLQMTKVSAADGAIFSAGGSQIIKVQKDAKFIGATFLINNPGATNFFGASVVFYINDGGRQSTIYASGNYGFVNGYNFITGMIPNKYAGTNTTVWAGIELAPLLDKEALVSNKYCLFTTMETNPYFVPIFDEQNLVQKDGTFEKGQYFLDENNEFNVVLESGTFADKKIIVNANPKTSYFTVSNLNNLTAGQYVLIDNSVKRIISISDSEKKVYVNSEFNKNLKNNPLTFKAPLIKKARF